MRVAHLAFSVHHDSAVYTLHSSLLDSGIVDSFVVTLYSSIPKAKGIISLFPPTFRFASRLVAGINRLFDSLLIVPTQKSTWSCNLLSYIGSCFFIPVVALLRPNIVHLHWIGFSCLSLRALKLFNKSKIVVTLHDYWFLTGGCHAQYDCRRFVVACTRCPLARSSLGDFLLRRIQLYKLNFLAFRVDAVICPSTSVRKLLVQTYDSHSAIPLPNSKVIPNIVQHDPVDSPAVIGVTREAYSRQNDLLRVGFYLRDANDLNKNLYDLLSALGTIGSPSEFQIIIVGESPRSLALSLEELPVYAGIDPVIFKSVSRIGYVPPVQIRSSFFSCIDCFAVVSLLETYSLISYESLLAGVPVVTYDDIGPADFVIDQKCGLVIPRSISSLAAALYSIRVRPSLMPRAFVATHFLNSTLQSDPLESHMGIYESALKS